jgi:hypothetical protein
MSKRRLIYVTHVDWGHVRQRPHHFACGLASRYDVTVVSPLARGARLKVANPAPEVRNVRLVRAPGSYRSAAVYAANNTLCAAELRALVPGKLDVVVVTAPECFAWLASRLDNAFVVYDCMDDALAFDQHEGVRRAKAALERSLLRRADLVAATSDALRDRCVARGAPPSRVRVIGNGWDAAAFPVKMSQALPPAGPLSLAYFGTIDAWLDVAALSAMLDAAPFATVELIGPNARGIAASHPRLRLRPPVPHAELAATVEASHAMLLPFAVDDLIRAVDPVKLYEYVALGKPVVSSYWPALDRFAPFVTFYRSTGELCSLIADRALRAPPPAPVRESFLVQCSWQARVDELAAAIA